MTLLKFGYRTLPRVHVHLQITTTLHKKGDYFELTGESGREWGVVSTIHVEYSGTSLIQTPLNCLDILTSRIALLDVVIMS